MENIFIDFKPFNSSKQDEQNLYLQNSNLENNLTQTSFSDFENDYVDRNKLLNPNIPWLSENAPKSKKQPIDLLNEYKKIIDSQIKNSEKSPNKKDIVYPKNKIVNEIINSDYSDEDKDYLITLANRESSFKPFVTNQFGYYGLYQFGKSALKDTGFTKKDFNDTTKQHAAALKLASINEKSLQHIIDKFSGKEFNGIKITKNGIRAAAHLLGSGTVKNYFNSVSDKFTDANGTSIQQYLKLFS